MQSGPNRRTHRGDGGLPPACIIVAGPFRPFEETIVSQQPVFHFHTEVRVRLPETDAMGIVFHGNFFTYLEVGRVDYLRNLKLSDGVRPIKEFENVVVAAHLDFKSPARLDDCITIDVRTSEINNSSFTFEFRLRNKSTNRVIATGYTTHCALGEAFKPIPVPESFREVIADFEQWNTAC